MSESTTPSFEPSFVVRDSLAGIRRYEGTQELVAFMGLTEQITRIQAMGKEDTRYLSYFSGWNKDGDEQSVAFSTHDLGSRVGYRILVNEEVHDLSNRRLDIRDFMVDLDTMRTEVSRTHDYRNGNRWAILPKSGPHLQYRGNNKLEIVYGEQYNRPMLPRSIKQLPENIRLSESIRRHIIATELAQILSKLEAGTREDDAHF